MLILLFACFLSQIWILPFSRSCFPYQIGEVEIHLWENIGKIEISRYRVCKMRYDYECNILFFIYFNFVENDCFQPDSDYAGKSIVTVLLVQWPRYLYPKYKENCQISNQQVYDPQISKHVAPSQPVLLALRRSSYRYYLSVSFSFRIICCTLVGGGGGASFFPIFCWRQHKKIFS